MKAIKSTTPRTEEITPKWHLIDAKGRILGRVATDISTLLIGKDKAIYAPHANVGDKVVVINAGEIQVTGNKLDQKTYYRHTGYPGGIRSETLRKLMGRKPTEALRKAVSGMLPKNKHRKHRLANLYIYPGSEHPHQGQVKA